MIKTNRIARFCGLFVAVAVPTICIPSKLIAQARPQGRLAEVVISVVDDSAANWLSQGLPNSPASATTFWILRCRDGQQRNIIVLRKSTASPALLLSAMQAFQALAPITRWLPKSRFKVSTLEGDTNKIPDASTARFYSQLRRSSAVAVRYLGKFPALTIELPVKVEEHHHSN